ncbi:MAG: hypothetical protein P8185_12825 [Deltaproteobacteria bacterium]|jgi:hypothetical protein
MKPKRSPTYFNILKFLALSLLAGALVIGVSGCTTKVLQIAEEKASPENSQYWKIDRVVSAFKAENGNISVCVELNDPDEKEIAQLNTLTLPLSILTGDASVMEKLGLRPEACPFNDANCYWYPVEKLKTGCETVAAETLSAGSIIPIEKLGVTDKDRNRDYRLPNNINKNQQTTERIYEISFNIDKENTEKEMDSDQASEGRETGSKKISIMYWPAHIDSQGRRPIIIAGAYEDNSTNLYYLLVPPAIVGDVVIAAAVIMVMAIAQCPYCFTAANH